MAIFSLLFIYFALKELKFIKWEEYTD
jgi:hypothetical protein